MHPGDITASLLPEYVFYALLVLLISVSVIYAGRKNRLWPAVWLYYVVTLSPMLGIIQVGGQWVADRYSYLPSLGISLLWGTGVAYASDRVARGDKKSVYRFYLSLAVCQLLLYTIQTVRQIPVWRTTETLATRIIDKAPHVSGAPYLARAIYRNETGRYAEALEDCGEAMKISLRRGLTATYSEIAYEQAVILKNLGRYLEALTVIEWGIQVSVGPPPNDAINLRDNLGRAVAEGRTRR
jgi:tetratricopeptide (TPR) repeat protein